jgi:hypothetical protein
MDHGMPLINMAVSAGAIYIVRNPLDVAISLAHFSNVSVDRAIDDMATPGYGVKTTREHVRTIWGSWTENVGSWSGRPHPTILVVRYEDLVARPREAFGGIARHLMMTLADEQLDRAIEMTGFERLREKEAADGFNEKPRETARFFRQGQVGQWREQLSEEQIARIVKTHQPTMRRFGYLPEQMT